MSTPSKEARAGASPTRSQSNQKPWNSRPQNGPFKPTQTWNRPQSQSSPFNTLNAPGGAAQRSQIVQGGPRRGNVCSRCGKTPPHGRMQCPGRDAVCHNCSQKGHFKSMCRNRSTVKDVSELEYDEIAFLDVIESDTAVVKAEGQAWMINSSSKRLKCLLIQLSTNFQPLNSDFTTLWSSNTLMRPANS